MYKGFSEKDLKEIYMSYGGGTSNPYWEALYSKALTNQHDRCRLCGGKAEDVESFEDTTGLCSRCTKRVVKVGMKTIVERTRYKKFCRECNSHVDACSCPSRKALDTLGN